MDPLLRLMKLTDVDLMTAEKYLQKLMMLIIALMEVGYLGQPELFQTHESCVARQPT
jgi:hypothetical protein